MIQPNTRSSFTSTMWNSAGKARRTINSAKLGGPNRLISEGSKVQFGEGEAIWDVVRIFEDGTIQLSTATSGKRISRKVGPDSPSWTNLWLVDGKKVSTYELVNPKARSKSQGGGPNRTIDVGATVLIGNSSVKWTVQSVLKDGSVRLATMVGDQTTLTTVGPKSKFWRSLRSISA